jgi:hypothetical protein
MRMMFTCCWLAHYVAYPFPYAFSETERAFSLRADDGLHEEIG